MLHCPNCGAEVSETHNFCWKCGASLKEPKTPEAAVRAVLIARIEGIKHKDIEVVRKTIEDEHYTKFDDWPPFERQGIEALKREEQALHVLKRYDYETSDWRIDIFDDAAVASFTIKYEGQIRKRRFYIKSRVSAFLIKRGDKWKIVHEHWSRFPETL